MQMGSTDRWVRKNNGTFLNIEKICYIFIDYVVYSKLNKSLSNPMDDQTPLPYFTWTDRAGNPQNANESVYGKMIFRKMSHFAGFGSKIMIIRISQLIIKSFKPNAKCLRQGYPRTS